jgi:mRNA interferase MazF
MTYQFGDIVLVRFPFTDQFTSKQRPGVIVSCAAYNRVRRDVVLMAITSQVRASGTYGEVIVQDWLAAKLLKPSAIKPVLATLEQSLVIKALGKLSQRDAQTLREVLGKIIGERGRSRPAARTRVVEQEHRQRKFQRRALHGSPPITCKAEA